MDYPFGSPSVDAAGNVYGAAFAHSNQQTVLWKLSPPPASKGGGGSGGTIHLKAPKLSRPGKSTVVEDTEPEFHWTRVPGATSYELVVTDITPGIRPSLANAVDETDITGTSFKLNYTLNPAHYYSVQVRAFADDPDQPGPWSNSPHFKIAEQKTRYFRIRLDKTLELSAGASYARFVFTVQALDDSEGRPALGPPRLMIFRGPGKSAPTGPVELPVGFSGVSTWDDLTTPKKMSVDELDGPGTMTLQPSLSLGVSIFGSPTILTFLKPGHHITDSLDVTSDGVGITLLSLYTGIFSVERPPNYDPDLWPNTLNP
jgi:hypothetical protein